MRQLPLKYNPGLNSTSELEAQFVVRHGYLQLLLDTLRENIASKSNQHLLIVGPRGTGKTMLVHRIAVALRTDTALSRQFMPVVFAEESYVISTPGEFWLEALIRLGDETQDSEIARAAERLKEEHDDTVLRERSLGVLIKFSQEKKKKLVLMVENLNMLLSGQLTQHDAWELRHTLLNEPSFILLGTAITNIFAEIKHSSKAWFELFAVYNLDPLSTDESSIFWKSITGNELSAQQLRPVQILTGGNPRLMRILAEFASQNSFRDLMANLVALVDEHTEYFKSQIDVLPSVERKVFVSLLDLWEPVSTRRVADAARMPVTACSSLLNRLVSRGIVTVSHRSRRAKLYEAAERLYNIYYLLRKRGHPSHRVEAVVRFMISFYHRSELVASTAKIAAEACELEPERRRDHYSAYEGILSHAATRDLAKAIIDATPAAFFSSADLPESVRILVESFRTTESSDSGLDPKVLANPLFWTAIAQHLQELGRDKNKIEFALQKAIELSGEDGHFWAHLGAYLSGLEDRRQEALSALEKAVQLAPQDSWAWFQYGSLLEDLDRPSDAIHATRQCLELKKDYSEAWVQLGRIYHDQDKFKDAESVLLDGLRNIPTSDVGELWEALAELYQYHLALPGSAEDAYRRALATHGRKDRKFIYLNLGRLLLNDTNRKEEAKRYFRIAEKAYRNHLKKNPNGADDWAQFSRVLANIEGKESDAEGAIRRAIELTPKRTRYWDTLMDCLYAAGKLSEAENDAKEAITTFGDARSWRRLGWVYEVGEKYLEAAKSYEKAIELQGDYLSAWVGLGRVLAEEGTSLEKAEEALSKALAWGANPVHVLPDLIRVKSQLGRETKEIEELLHKSLLSAGKAPKLLNSVAWALYKSGRHDLIQLAHIISREAVERSQFASWDYNHTFGMILCAEHRFTDAVPLLNSIFDAAEKESGALTQGTDLTVRLAAAGYAEAVLDLLDQSSGKIAYEPVRIALQMMLGKESVAPLEITEVAKDILKKIHEAQSDLEQGKPEQSMPQLAKA